MIFVCRKTPFLRVKISLIKNKVCFFYNERISRKGGKYAIALVFYALLFTSVALGGK